MSGQEEAGGRRDTFTPHIFAPSGARPARLRRGGRDGEPSLPLHIFKDGDAYILGIFLTGAYQEILGDLHNLFGDTNAVHVSTDARGEVVVDAVIKGDTVREVLDYVEFEPDQLVQHLRVSIEQAVRAGHIGDNEAGRFLRFYEEGLGGYTYLEEPSQG